MGGAVRVEEDGDSHGDFGLVFALVVLMSVVVVLVVRVDLVMVIVVVG